MISTTGTTITYTGDGTTKQFSWPYAYYDSSHIVGYTIDANGTIAKILNNFSFDAVNSKFIYPVEGGAITSAYKLKLKRVTPLNQLLDLPDEYPYNNIESAQDKLTMIMQELTYIGETSIPEIETAVEEQLNETVENKLAAASSATAAAKSAEEAEEHALIMGLIFN